MLGVYCKGGIMIIGSLIVTSLRSVLFQQDSQDSQSEEINQGGSLRRLSCRLEQAGLQPILVNILHLIEVQVRLRITLLRFELELGQSNLVPSLQENLSTHIAKC